VQVEAVLKRRTVPTSRGHEIEKQCLIRFGGEIDQFALALEEL